MERLTYKLDEPITTKYLDYKYMRIPDYCISKGNYGRITDDDIYNKLGKLEDIEQELGIPLEVLFKALKDGIYRFYEEFEDEPPYIRFADVSIGYDKDNNTWVFECSNLDIYDLKDYGKTWALTREELENVKD